MDAPKTTAQPFTLLDLPFDILHSIFAHFQTTKRDNNGRIGLERNRRVHMQKDDLICRQTIQSLRLVCRSFCHVASELLCPVLRVSLDRESLRIAELISQSPSISRGVRSVHVYLDYCPGELAANLGAFTDYRQKCLKEMSRRCDYMAETWFLGGYDEDDETVCDHPLRVYNAAMDNCSRMCLSWNAYIDPNIQDEGDEEMKEYQRILQCGFDGFRQRHLDQQQLILDGGFVNTLAACISRMSNAHSLALYDDLTGSFYDQDPTLLLNDKEMLSNFMVDPLNWKSIEALGGELLPARILSGLPINIHKMGANIDQLLVGCFPLQGNYSFISPKLQGLGWANLHTSFQHLRVFEIGGGSMNHKEIRHDYLAPEEQAHINNYLSAAFSSKNLEVVEINLYALGLNDGRSNKKGYPRLDSVLTAVTWPRIRRLRVLSVELSQTEFESFCRGLGEGLQFFQMSSVILHSGRWVTTLDILREKIWGEGSKQKCRVYLSSLGGGEFHQKGPVKMRDPFSIADWDLEEPPLIAQSQEYISGVSAENPLKAL